MNQTSKSMEKKIRSVKTWLDRAEQAYADDSTAKGQLQLMLAKAEMQHLDEQQGATKRHKLYLIGGILLALLIAIGVYFMNIPMNKPSLAPSDGEFTTVTNEIDSTKSSTGTNSNSSNGTNMVYPAGATTGNTGNQQLTSTDSNGTAAQSSLSVNSTSSTMSTDGTVQTERTSSDGESMNQNTSVSTSTADEMTQTAPVNEKEDTIAEPVISNSQIQEAVREGGRSLRGQ